MNKQLLFVVAGVALMLSAFTLNQGSAVDMSSEWESYKAQHGKNYDEQEEVYRFAIYVQNKQEIDEHNNKDVVNFYMGVNKFTDLSKEEFKRFLGYKPSQKDVNAPVHVSKKTVTGGSKDWRDLGAVTGVKDQGYCGSCWAFGTVGGIEGGWFLSQNELVSFSEQQINSCDQDDWGCDGGDLPTAYNYVNGAGLATEQNYPYKSGGGTTHACKADRHTMYIKEGQVTGHMVQENHRDAYISALDEAPLSICVAADYFQSYSHGIVTKDDGCGYSIDHCVTAVQYDLDASEPYTTIKNSWASDWGEEGYIRISTYWKSSGKAREGVCGIYTEPYLADISA